MSDKQNDVKMKLDQIHHLGTISLPDGEFLVSYRPTKGLLLIPMLNNDDPIPVHTHSHAERDFLIVIDKNKNTLTGSMASASNTSGVIYTLDSRLLNPKWYNVELRTLFIGNGSQDDKLNLLRVELEQRYNIKLDFDHMKRMKTLGDLYEAVSETIEDIEDQKGN